jgi:hypothetical protein
MGTNWRAGLPEVAKIEKGRQWPSPAFRVHQMVIEKNAFSIGSAWLRNFHALRNFALRSRTISGTCTATSGNASKNYSHEYRQDRIPGMDGAHHAALRPAGRKHQKTNTQQGLHRWRGTARQPGRDAAAEGQLPLAAALPLCRQASLLHHQRQALLQAHRRAPVHPRKPERCRTQEGLRVTNEDTQSQRRDYKEAASLLWNQEKMMRYGKES